MNIISGLKDFFNASSFIYDLKWPECADAVGYSFIIRVPCVFFDILFTLLSNICLGKSVISCILTFKRFVLGIDRAKMRLYDCEQQAQDDILDNKKEEEYNDDEKKTLKKSFSEFKF